MSEEGLREFVKGVLRGEIFTDYQIARRAEHHCPKCEGPTQWLGPTDCPKCEKLVDWIFTGPSWECPECETKVGPRCGECKAELVEVQVPTIDIGLVFLPLAFGALADWPKAEIEKIGCVWAFNRTALPRGINGYPMLTESRLMHKDDWTRAHKAIVREQQREIEI